MAANKKNTPDIHRWYTNEKKKEEVGRGSCCRYKEEEIRSDGQKRCIGEVKSIDVTEAEDGSMCTPHFTDER